MSAISGQAKVMRNLSNYSKNALDEVRYACEAVQAKIVNDAIARAPEDTGNLKRNIQAGDIIIEDKNVTAIVNSNAPYSTYVEFGTRRAKAQPFLGPSLYANQATFRKAIGAAIKRARAM